MHDARAVRRPFRIPPARCALPLYSPNVTGEYTCRAGYYDIEHPDASPVQWFLNCCPSTSTADFGYGLWNFLDPFIHHDIGLPVYLGTLVLDIPPDAKGRYTIGMMGSPDTAIVLA